MDFRVQKHMLEHVDGTEGGRGGVILNYDCENYECDDDLIDNLEAFALDYDFVYVAPYKNMKNKVILTKLNQIKTLDQYDEEIVRAFIGQ